jgi:hypothetical protein
VDIIKLVAELDTRARSAANVIDAALARAGRDTSAGQFTETRIVQRDEG